MFGRYWITNGAVHAQHAIVFAQLVIDGVGYGVHAVLVSIRDKNMRPLPGVTVLDMGIKMGLNGVDNARLSFDSVCVPRTNLLNRSVFLGQGCMTGSRFASEDMAAWQAI